MEGGTLNYTVAADQLAAELLPMGRPPVVMKKLLWGKPCGEDLDDRPTNVGATLPVPLPYLRNRRLGAPDKLR